MLVGFAPSAAHRHALPIGQGRAKLAVEDRPEDELDVGDGCVVEIPEVRTLTVERSIYTKQTRCHLATPSDTSRHRSRRCMTAAAAASGCRTGLTFRVSPTSLTFQSGGRINGRRCCAVISARDETTAELGPVASSDWTGCEWLCRGTQARCRQSRATRSSFSSMHRRARQR